MPFVCSVWHVLGPPPVGVQQPFPAQHDPPPLVPTPHVVVCPDGHAQDPVVHVAPLGQVQPHVPQLDSSVLVFTQAPLQGASPVGHWHAPEMQVAPVAQRVPQAPQLASSVWRLTHAVGAATGQPVVPGGQAQVPASHASPASGQA